MLELVQSRNEPRPAVPAMARPSIDVGIDKLTEDLSALSARLSATNLMLSLHLVECQGLVPGLAEALLRRVVGGQGRITQVSPYDYVVTMLGPDRVLLRGDSLPTRLAGALAGLLGPGAPALTKVQVRSLDACTNEIVDPAWLLQDLASAPAQRLDSIAA